VCHGFLYYKSREQSYLISSITAAAVAPFTLLVLIPDVNKLMAMAHGENDAEPMEKVFDRWSIKSTIRTMIFSVSYGIFLWNNVL